ncbi:UNC-like C-terminal-domain-containing protein [Paraphoma chrysanthemicola]|nr:UNC-like C-terminal-domain-containing protein [Paraphoma chrysanthemicola]
MPAIGATLRKWTLCLLLCSSPTPAYAQATNETATSDSRATVSSSTTTYDTSSAGSLSASTARPYTASETTCPFRTINYITHTLPQQCAKATWSAPGEAATAKGNVVVAEVTPSLQTAAAAPNETGERSVQGAQSDAEAASSQTGAAGSVDTFTESSTANTEAEAELETDSPLDNANFLSFEEWKKKNLAQVGQSPENVGQGRAPPSNQAARRRPVNVNALDSLGEEAEIELDFAGFGTPPDGENAVGSGHAGAQDVGATKATGGEKKAAPSSWALSKDAGKTCKERFNYASFDCAATVLKTNKQAKSATSILVENKDSYMLNECSADNKFLIVELCDDILVDTVVLGNYEFFSSMFRHFRVSVSDRYPVKMERWRTLATFEARNSRDIQPFLITEPQIWARYLRIEFLTQYGNEYYCPLSLLRVHGTTMMEQFRREEEEARGVDDDVDLEVVQDNVVKPAIDSGPIPADQVPIQAVGKDTQSSETSTSHAARAESDQADRSSVSIAADHQRSIELSSSTTKLAAPPSGALHVDHKSAEQPTPGSSSLDVDSPANSSRPHTSHSSKTNPTMDTEIDTLSPLADSGVNATNASATAAPKNSGVAKSGVNDTVAKPSNASSARAMDNAAAASSSIQSQPRSTPTQPNPATPSTQESFFKSIHKRLLYLEANSTLSLQYIEEQSRILRDAFMKVEKRQLAKTEKFLDHLNSTVMLELKSFRTMYDQLWQSTVIELESMKERQKTEVGEIGTRLSLMADELVWQKRMAVVQSTLLLLCLGLVLFVRSGTLGSAADVPIVQQLGSKYTSFFESSPPRSPPESGIARRRRILRSMWRSDTSAGLSDHQSDGAHVASDAELEGTQSPVQIEYSPPTPDTPGALAESDLRNGLSPLDSPNTDPLAEGSSPNDDTPGSDDQAKRLEVLETQSGPATPNGTRDSRPSWEEVDRAIDQLKAEERGEPTPRATKKDRERKKKRSPLRRAHSSFDGTTDNEPTTDSGSELFL